MWESHIHVSILIEIPESYLSLDTADAPIVALGTDARDEFSQRKAQVAGRYASSAAPRIAPPKNHGSASASRLIKLSTATEKLIRWLQWARTPPRLLTYVHVRDILLTFAISSFMFPR